MPTVTLLPSGATFTAAASERVLDAALRCGVPLAYGCRNGACRSCAARVVSGHLSYPGGEPKALDAAERAAGRALLCAAIADDDVTLEVELPDGGIAVRTLPCRVVRKRVLAHDVVALELALPANERLAFRAGQYVDILLRDGRRRAFSIANAPGRGAHLELHIRRVPGGSFSGHAFDALRERALLRLEGPLGSFWLRREHRRPLILVAGGTGFAPIKSMLEDALDRGLREPVHLYRGARARRDLYLDELGHDWAGAHHNLTYVPVLSEPGAGDDWSGRSGLVHEAVLADHPQLAPFSIYLSGPPPMVDAARAAFPAAGADPRHLYSDAFDYAYETGHDDPAG